MLTMMRTVFWKEWREHRWKYAAFWFALNFPILLVALSVGLSPGARVPFGDLSDANAVKFLGVAMVAQSGLLAVVFPFLAGLLAVATFHAEIEEESLFFVYEQPQPRWRYPALKLLNGSMHVVVAVTVALLLAPVVSFLLMWAGGRVTWGGSLDNLVSVLVAAGRAAVWCSLLSLVAFTASALLAALLPRWWLAATGSVLFVAAVAIAGSDFFDFIEPSFEMIREGASISIGIGSPQWITVTDPVPLGNFAMWRAAPLLTATLLATAFSCTTGVLYTRKELK